MTVFKVVLRRPAWKALESMHPREAARIEKGLAALRVDPLRPRPGADIGKLRGVFGREDLYRLRVGNWRAFYAVRGDEVVVIDIRPRGPAYD